MRVLGQKKLEGGGRQTPPPPAFLGLRRKKRNSPFKKSVSFSTANFFLQKRLIRFINNLKINGFFENLCSVNRTLPCPMAKNARFIQYAFFCQRQFR